jgi:hypothetical protein
MTFYGAINFDGFLKNSFFALTKLHIVALTDDAEKQVSERKLRLQEAPEARKLLFRAADQPRRLGIPIPAKT